jgi:O-antigen/teichoic acid export membrane protein
MPSSNTKRIAKNSLMLYFRMFILMAVTLYTSRVVLNALGVEDYGIYSVVGGIIVMLSFINGAMAGAIQRFLAFEIGKNNKEGLNIAFNTSVIIHFAIVLIILILGETVGLWFFNTKLNIPETRMNAAFWVYQLSIVACIINIISIPYNAAITAYEKMNAFAWISLFDAGGRFLSAYLLLSIAGDKLIWYAVFVCIVQLIVRLLYGIYCKRNFTDIKLTLLWNKQCFKKMLGFASWNAIGQLSTVLVVQGLDFLLNIFFNPIANAAKGIAMQVQAAVNTFFQSFQQAVNPQIIKNYASSNLNYMHKLVFMSSRLSFYIVLIIALPICFQTEYILNLWLKQAPENTVIFTQITMFICAITAMGQPFITGNMATGKIKMLMIMVGVINCMKLPLAFVWLKLGGSQATVFLSWLIISSIAYIVRLFVVKKQINFSMKKYLKECLLPIIFVSGISIAVVYGYSILVPEHTFLRLSFLVLLSIVSVGILMFAVGITKDEKNLALRFIKSKIKKS